MVSAVIHQLRPRTRASRVVMVAALGWAASAVFHIGVFAVDGGGLSGAVSWRKPIVFSISISLTLWAVGWVLDRVPTARPRLAGAIAWVFAVASTIETALVVLQTWRGRASHFNVFEPGDAAIFELMGSGIVVMSAALLTLFAWTLVERPADAATRWAVIGGMAAIVAGLGIGQWLIDLGFQHVARFGTVPDVVTNGDAVAKFPHAIAFHGIQIFALLLAMADVAGPDVSRRATVMRVAVAGYLGLLTFATVQSIAGLAPLALRPWSIALIAASVAALGWATATMARAARARHSRHVPVTLRV